MSESTPTLTAHCSNIALALSGAKDPSVSSQWHVVFGFSHRLRRAACSANS